MSVRTELNPSRTSRSLVTALAIAFVVLSVIPLLLVSSLLGFIDFEAQRKALFYEQQLIAAEAARKVSGFIEQIFSTLEASAQVGRVSDREQQQLILEKLLGVEDAVRELVLVDKAGQKIVGASRRSLLASSNLLKLINSDVLTQVSQDQHFVSAIYIDEETSEPLVSLAVPVKDVFGDFQGALLAEVNLKFMWDVVDALQVKQTGMAYVVDREGNLIAFRDTARVLKGENLGQLTEVAKFIRGSEADENELYSIGINGSAVVATYVPLGTPDWAVVTEIPVEEAYQSSIYSAALLLVTFLVMAIFAAGTGIYVSRNLTRPLLNLTQTATRLAAGEIGLQAAIEGSVEVVRLASAFNHMTAQLQELIGSLEQRVVDRTQRLEIAATLGERVSAILNLDQLLAEVVNQIKASFGYYHAHIYLLDNKREKLVVAEGTGTAGAEMKAKGHSISLDAPTSLVARAARTGEIVRVDNVREAPDWLPNPLLPNTYSEMAVPIILDEQVVGVLDVQEDEIAGLDEGDANLLRSLASQVAVAMRNARLFNEVETALAEARAAQERYLEQAWNKAKIMARQGQYHYKRPDAPDLSEAKRQALAEAKGQVLEQSRLVTVELKSDGGSTTPAVISPVVLHNRPIGALQIYPASDDQTWTEDDLAVIAAVTEELAQTAENLRLFEETRQDATREQTIRAITEKMRAASSLEKLVKTAAEELGQRFSAQFALVELGIDEADEPAVTPSNGKHN